MQRQSVGRPRRGTELLREQALIDAAARVFLRGGYFSSSIQKVAHEAGVSTRTIYERYRNKGELLGAVVSNFVDKDLTSISDEELDCLSVEKALLKIGTTMAERITSPAVSSLLRLLVTEYQRFPELVLAMRAKTKDRIDNAVSQYFLSQAKKGTLKLRDPAKSALLFAQMIHGEFTDSILFGSARVIPKGQLNQHVAFAVDFFLRGAKAPAPMSEIGTDD